MNYNKALKLRLDFLFDEMECSRVMLIPSGATLDDLHTMIQACGNWLNYHLYDFKYVSGGRLVQAEPLWQLLDLEDFTPEVEKLDAKRATVEGALSEMPSMVYSYDYGDGWEIAITLLGFVYHDGSGQLPRVVKARGAWPPDDVGGEGGLIRFLQAWDDPDDPEHEHLVGWGRWQGFEKCSSTNCNRRLAKWREFAAKTE